MTKTRRAILKAMEKLSERYPGMRFGQLVINVANWATQVPDAAWDVEDGKFLAAAKRHLQKQVVREGTAATNRKARSRALHAVK